ncbi:type II toxin-antitoxin system RelE/ParE family toxin [Coriobacteriales bacterium OH1046]|nr:type II toxin-antitoxin system RelE/ParE family toxin [Coriobacteriales bacterium OH1046]
MLLGPPFSPSPHIYLCSFLLEAAEFGVGCTEACIAVPLEAPSAAGALLDECEQKLEIITDNPKLLGVDLYASEAVNRQVRRCSVKRCRVYYLVDDEHNTAYVVTVCTIYGISRACFKSVTAR